jgi:hypothetical protein
MPSLVASLALDATNFNAAAARVTERTRAMGAQMSKVGFGKGAIDAAVSAEKIAAMRGEMIRSGFSPAAAAAALRAQDLADGANKATRATSALGKGVAIAAAYMSFDFLRNQAVKLLEFGGNMADLSARTGVSATALQTWSYALKQNGGDINDAVKYFEKLAVSRREALEGDDKKLASFAKLGVSKEMLQTGRLEDIGAQIGKSFEGGADPQQFMAELRDVGGRSAGELVAMFSQGFGQIAAEAQGLGVVMSEQTVAALDTIGDRLDLLKTQFQTKLAPVFVFIAEQLMNAVNGLGMLGSGLKGYVSTLVETVVQDPSQLMNPVGLLTKSAKAGVDAMQAYVQKEEAAQDSATSAKQRSKVFQGRDLETKADKQRRSDALKENKDEARDKLTILDDEMRLTKDAAKGHSVGNLQQMGGFLGNFAAAAAPEVALLNSQLNELQQIRKLLQKQARTGVDAGDIEY